ncbi:ABC transporter ATP-binding protein [Candidatus Fermentibacterales bacterium]|nr:ABC transporter ATP-binding protein [Candidatus Fermentibacterales bacterium]
MDSVVLRARGAEKRYGSTRAVAGVDLEIPEGEVLALLGPNGAGKTTLMKMFLGLVSPDSGELSISGTSTGDPASRRGVAYLPESLDLPHWSTPRVFWRHIGRLRAIGEGAKGLMDAAERMGCSDLLDRSFGKMSRGQRQRCLVSVVTAGSPAVLLLDEPSAGLDPAGRVRLRNLIRSLASAGTTVMINSHLLGEVERTCDTAAFITEGSLIAGGRLDELSAATGFAEIRTPTPETLLPWLQERGYSADRAQRDSLRVALTGTDLAEGLRSLTAEVLRSGAEFSSIGIVRESLEQVFLRLTGEPGTEESGR